MLDQFLLTCVFMLLGCVLGLVLIALALTPAGWMLTI